LQALARLLNARTEAGRTRRHVKVRDAIKLIEDDGWVLTRTRGSHRQYKHPVKPAS
jgi:hypothetical protein